MAGVFRSTRGFTLVELVIVIVVLGILAAVAIPKFLDMRGDAEQAAVAQMVASLESALTIHVSKQVLDGGTIAVHNPFDDLSNIPANYNGVSDVVNPTNTPDGTWTFRTAGNWIMYNPKGAITGGWSSGGQRFIIYQIQTVMEGTDVVGLRLTTTPTYEYTWN
jgi:MSHA pilin protein MshA